MEGKERAPKDAFYLDASIPKVKLAEGIFLMHAPIERGQKACDFPTNYKKRFMTVGLCDYPIGIWIAYDPSMVRVTAWRFKRDSIEGRERLERRMEQEGWTVIDSNLKKVFGYRKITCEVSGIQ